MRVARRSVRGLVLGLLALLGLMALGGGIAHAAPSVLDEVPAALRTGPTGQPLDAEQSQALLARKTLSQLVDATDGGPRPGVAISIIDAPPADVFRVLRDYPHFQDFMPYIKRVNIDEHAGNRWLVSYVVRGPMGIGNRDYQLEVFDEKETVSGLEVLVSRFSFTGKGNIKDTRGTWHLVPINGGRSSFVRYLVRTDPGGSFPGWMKNKIASSGLARVVEAVRKRVASAGDH